MREGAAALGVWLPLAFADLLTAVAKIGGTNLDRERLLDSWALPELAKAVRRDAEECEEQETVEQFEMLFKRYG